MAQHCQFCGKTPMTGRRISHAHNVTSRKWHLNLATVRAVVNGVPGQYTLSTNGKPGIPSSGDCP